MSNPDSNPWQAPHGGGPVRARITLPGSKSITNRALLLAAIADRPSTISRPLLARDTRLMLGALSSLGVGLVHDEDAVTVEPAPLRGPATVDCGLAGTVMRFVPPVAALADGVVDFDGDARARERPMGEILAALRALGVDIDPAAASLPFRLHGRGHVEGGVVTIDASSSSQFVSALLLAGARYERGLDIRHEGKPVPSLPHVEMTTAMLRERGVGVDTSEPNRWVVSPGAVDGISVDVEPDLSNAAPFLAAALATDGEVSVAGWPQYTTQPGDQLRSILAQFGADVAQAGGTVTVTGTGHLEGIDVDLHDVGELTPVIAAVAALADSPSYLRGVSHLRGHETDRLAALATELRLLGCDARETEDGLEIHPQPMTGGLFHTYDDHRMAHAAVVLGLAVDNLLIENVETTAKTYPDFPDAWMAMLA